MPATRPFFVLIILMFLGAACGPTERAQPRAAGDAPSARRESRTLVFIARQEEDNLANLGGVGTHTGTLRRFFNATLALADGRGVPRAYLAEALPQLGTDTWQTFADGRMETTYRLRPGLTWHDGAPASAEDFVFAHRIYMNPGLEKGAPRSLPQNQMEDIRAADERTLVVRWLRPFAGAGSLAEEFRPLPRHILEPVLRQGEPALFDNHPYWTVEFIGLGPFQLARWDPGATMEGIAFEGHALGQPRIDRLRIQFNSDPNAVVAILLAGGAHLVADTTLRFQSGLLLRQEWQARNGGGQVFLTPFQVRYTQIQVRPELVSPRAILDARARKALVHATDRASLSDGLFEGQGVPAETIVPRNAEHYATVERAMARYPHDPRRAEQLLGELGFTKGTDGFFASAAEGRFNPEWRATAGGDSDAQLAILVDGLRRTGIDARSYIIPRPQADDRQVRATFPALSNSSTTGESARWYRSFSPEEIPAAENFWAGSNRGGWSNADYARLYRSFTAQLDRDELIQTVVQMMQILSEDVGVIPLYYNLDVTAHVAELHAPDLVAPDASIGWNVHEWDLRL